MSAEQRPRNPVDFLGRQLSSLDDWDAMQLLLNSLNVPDLFPNGADNARPSSISSIARRGDIVAVSWKIRQRTMASTWDWKTGSVKSLTWLKQVGFKNERWMTSWTLETQKDASSDGWG